MFGQIAERIDLYNIPALAERGLACVGTYLRKFGRTDQFGFKLGGTK